METPSEDLMRCKKCRMEKHPSAMSRSKHKDRPSSVCKGCYNAAERLYKQKRRAALGMSDYGIELSKRSPYEQRLYRERQVRYQKKSDARRFARMTDEEASAHKAKLTAACNARRAVLKQATFEAYGGYQCKCCGETERTFLSVDHIFNDGNEHRRKMPKVNGGYSLYVWLRDHGYPAGFQILCMNCQTGKRLNGGICPHKTHQVTCDGQGASPYAQASGNAVQLP